MSNQSSQRSNNNNNVVNFSDLSEEEKQKYFEFLQNNNIVFENDNGNNYVATIKVKTTDKQLHPQSPVKPNQPTFGTTNVHSNKENYDKNRNRNKKLSFVHNNNNKNSLTPTIIRKQQKQQQKEQGLMMEQLPTNQHFRKKSPILSINQSHGNAANLVTQSTATSVNTKQQQTFSQQNKQPNQNLNNYIGHNNQKNYNNISNISSSVINKTDYSDNDELLLFQQTENAILLQKQDKKVDNILNLISKIEIKQNQKKPQTTPIKKRDQSPIHEQQYPVRHKSWVNPYQTQQKKIADNGNNNCFPNKNNCNEQQELQGSAGGGGGGGTGQGGGNAISGVDRMVQGEGSGVGTSSDNNRGRIRSNGTFHSSSANILQQNNNINGQPNTSLTNLKQANHHQENSSITTTASANQVSQTSPAQIQTHNLINQQVQLQLQKGQINKPSQQPLFPINCRGDRSVPKSVNSGVAAANQQQRSHSNQRSFSQNRQEIDQLQMNTTSIGGSSNQNDCLGGVSETVGSSSFGGIGGINLTNLNNNNSITNNFTNLSQAYSKLIQQITLIDIGMRPTRWPKNVLSRYMEEIYCTKFQRNTAFLRQKKNNANVVTTASSGYNNVPMTTTSNGSNSNTNTNTSNCSYSQNRDTEQERSFAEFVYGFFIEKFKSVKLAEQNLLNLVASIDLHMQLSSDVNVKVFSNFLAEKYERDELIFFLFVRSMIEKQMNIEFYNPRKKFEDVSLTHLSHKTCFLITSAVFGIQEESLIERFMNLIEKHMSINEQNELGINIYQFLELALLDYSSMKKNIVMNATQNSVGGGGANRSQGGPSFNGDSIGSGGFSQQTRHVVQNPEMDSRNAQQAVLSNQYLLFDNDSFANNNGMMNGSEGDVPPPITTKNQEDVEYQNKKEQGRMPEQLVQPNFFQINEQNEQDSRDDLEVNISILNNQMNKSQNNMIKENERRSSSSSTVSQNKRNQQTGGGQQQQEPEQLPQLLMKSQNKSNQEYQPKTELEEKVIQKMDKKVKEFVDMMISDSPDFSEEEKSKKINEFNKILKKKTLKLLESLFTSDKLKWLNLLMIQEPVQEQLQYVENLQKELRSLQKKSAEDLKNSDLSNFCKKVLQTPELAKAIGKLLICMTIPDDSQ